MQVGRASNSNERQNGRGASLARITQPQNSHCSMRCTNFIRIRIRDLLKGTYQSRTVTTKFTCTPRRSGDGVKHWPATIQFPRLSDVNIRVGVYYRSRWILRNMSQVSYPVLPSTSRKSTSIPCISRMCVLTPGFAVTTFSSCFRVGLRHLLPNGTGNRLRMPYPRDSVRILRGAFASVPHSTHCQLDRSVSPRGLS